MALADLEDVENATIRKWAAMWRSIVTLSVLKHTYLPYYSYIHYLDLEDLWHLLCDLYTDNNKGLVSCVTS